ncbi:hypothetical protein MKZ38_003919 [Zalerion maritima]|uniref:Uncharacterized protein n=1 Tax=Zalerion maritima TaxID=339359 RepID=A0AAD5RMV8_9PEZI|nr:hypothetical protein MKZ38_003919 [Zalerion maritima]
MFLESPEAVVPHPLTDDFAGSMPTTTTASSGTADGVLSSRPPFEPDHLRESLLWKAEELAIHDRNLPRALTKELGRLQVAMRQHQADLNNAEKKAKTVDAMPDDPDVPDYINGENLESAYHEARIRHKTVN